MEEKKNPLSEIVAANGGRVPTPDQTAAEESEAKWLHGIVKSVDDYAGEYLPEDKDPRVLVRGSWLVRGGSAFWIATAGIGKSTSCMQLVHCMSAGIPFCGLQPRGALKFWVFQSEDSQNRVAQDMLDVRAELIERASDFDWMAEGRKVKFIDLSELDGRCGVAFLDELDKMLRAADRLNEKPDVIVLNPLLAFVGGPIVDGGYVTPFFRGGEIGRKETCGLQAILERHKVGVLIYHHTPKPPTEKEIDGWMKSQFPEYQGAGSSDITNWGRSFITMMRVKGHANVVCCTAGKNGSELGWERVGGAYRRYMAFSDEIGVSGKARHAWRELTPDEYDDIVGKEKKDDEKKAQDAVSQVVFAIKSAKIAPMTGVNHLETLMADSGLSRRVLRGAIATVVSNASKFGLTIQPILHADKHWHKHIGQAESLRAAADKNKQATKYAETMEKAGKLQNVDTVEAMVETKPAPQTEEIAQEELGDAEDFPF